MGNRKNAELSRRITEDGVEVFDGSRRYLQAAERAGLRRIVVSSSANTELVLRVTGLDRYVEGRIDGVTLAERHLAGKPARTPSWPAPSWPGCRRTQAAVFEDALAGVAAGRAGRFGCVVGVDRVGQADELRAHGADLVVRDLAELLTSDSTGPVITDARFPVEPWQVRELRPGPGHAGPERVGVRAVQRPHRACAATSTRATRAGCPAPT